MNGITILSTLFGVIVYLATRPEGRLCALAWGGLVALTVPVLVFT